MAKEALKKPTTKHADRMILLSSSRKCLWTYLGVEKQIAEKSNFSPFSHTKLL